MLWPPVKERSTRKNRADERERTKTGAVFEFIVYRLSLLEVDRSGFLAIKWGEKMHEK